MGNSPTNATDPSGLDRIGHYDDGTVAWITQTPTKLLGVTMWESDVSGGRHSIGTLIKDSARQRDWYVRIDEEFGAGVVPYKSLEVSAALTNGEFDNSRETQIARISGAIASLKQTLFERGWRFDEGRVGFMSAPDPQNPIFTTREHAQVYSLEKHMDQQGIPWWLQGYIKFYIPAHVNPMPFNADNVVLSFAGFGGVAEARNNVGFARGEAAIQARAIEIWGEPPAKVLEIEPSSNSHGQFRRIPNPTTAPQAKDALPILNQEFVPLQRIPGPIPGEAPLGSPLTAPHNAVVVILTPSGRIRLVKQLTSSGSNPETFERILPGWKGRGMHTEARATTRLTLLPGETMLIGGDKFACSSCKGFMNRAAAQSGANIEYLWWENGQLKVWRADPKRGGG